MAGAPHRTRPPFVILFETESAPGYAVALSAAWTT